MARKNPFRTPTLRFAFDRYIGGDPERIALFEAEQANAEVARKVYELRMKAGLTHQSLARLVGVEPSVITQLENADYEGNALAMLRRIAAVLDQRVEIRFVALKRKKQLA